MKSKTCIITAVAMFALATAGTAEAKPDEVSEAAVKDCRFLSQVDGSSGYSKRSDWKSVAKARAERKAGSLGASHIVFTNYRAVGAFNGEATARAYDCRS